MSKKQKSPKASTAEKLPFALVVKAPANTDKHQLFVDTFQKVKASASIDAFFYGEGAESLFNYVNTNEEYRNLFSSLENAGTDEPSMLKCMSAIEGGKYVYFDLTQLEKSFNTNDLYTKVAAFKDIHYAEVEFKHVDQQNKRGIHPIKIYSGEFLNYSAKVAFTMGETLPEATRFLIKKLELDAARYQIHQHNPFAVNAKDDEKQRPFRFLNRFFHWFFTIPVIELKTKPEKCYSFIKESSLFRLAFAAVVGILFVLMPLMSRTAGISGDERTLYAQAGKVYNFYASMGKDTSALYSTTADPMHAYGESFDVISYVVNQIFNVENIFETRHMLNAWVGWLAILVSGLFATLLAGWRGGLITVLLMFFTPRFLGHAWNNPKDIPFAAAYIFALYFMARFLKNWPRPSFKNLAFIALGIAASISIRIGGLLLIAYLFMFSGLFYLYFFRFKDVFTPPNLRFAGSILLQLFFVSVSAYLLGILIWPYGLVSPLKNPLEALDLMTNFSISIRQLFDGDIIWSNNAPWYYTLQYLGISLPLIVLTGLVLFMVSAGKMYGRIKGYLSFMLIFAVAFPIVYIIYKQSNVYGGWRHSLFVFPPLAVLSGSGLALCYNFFKKDIIQWGIGIAMILLAFHPVRHTIVNHPHQYIYYNEIYGGIDNAMGEYEIDYYYHTLRAGSEWLKENRLNNLDEGETKIVAANAWNNYSFRHNENVKSIYARYYQRGNSEWDYMIVANAFLSPYQLEKGIWPPENTIHTIDIDGVPVCAIIERKNLNDYYGFQALEERNFNRAIPFLMQAVEEQKANEVAMLNLARAYLETRQYDKAIAAAQQCLKIYPNYDRALNFLGIAYMKKGDGNNAVAVFQRLIKANYKLFTAYHNIGLVYMQNSNPETALHYFNQAIEINGRYAPPYFAAAEVLQTLGRSADAQRYLQAGQQLQ